MRALVVDQYPLVVDALTLYLRDIDTEAEIHGAKDMASAWTLMETSGSLDLILLDFNTPGMNGLDNLRQVCESRPDAKVVMIGGSARAQDMLGALDRGAAGVLPKDYSRVAMIKALELILAGETHVPARLLGGNSGLREVQDSYSASRNGPLACLNPREREVLALLCEGLSNANIGKALGITADGVNHHLKHIYPKLGVHTRTQAMAIFFEASRLSA